MEVVITAPPAGADLVAGAIAHLVADAARAGRAPVLGLATGSSPLGVYRALAGAVAAGTLSLAGARAFALDEYVGLPPDHPQGYRAVIEREFTSAVDVDPAAVAVLDGGAGDPVAECARFENAVAGAGGVDLQLLGIGTDGHLGFNEPGSSLASRTRLKTLTAATRADNARFFDGDPGAVPRHVLTQGLGTIRQARHLVLLATGAAKAAAVAAAVEGPVTASCPASVLQLHPHVTVVVDDDAAGALAMAEYYRETWEGRPSWQRI